MKKLCILALLLAALSGSVFGQTPNGAYSSPAASSSGGIGTGGAPLAPGNFAFSPYCLPTNTFQCFFANANGIVDNTCSWTNASTAITCSDAPFKSTDVGKILWGYSSNFGGQGSGCDPYQSQPVAAAITATHNTIATFISATQVTINVNPANSSVNSTSCVIYGTPDDANAAALEAAYDVATSCPKVTMFAGNYIFTTMHFNTQPAGCQNLPGIFNTNNSGPNTFGNMFYSIGFELEGRGPGPTELFLPPDFPETGTCSFGTTGIACWHVVGEGYYHDIAMFSGGGGGLPANKILWEAGQASTLAYFTCGGIGGATTGTVGIDIGGQAQLQQVNLSACGETAYLVDASTGSGGGYVYSYPAAKCFRCTSDNTFSQGATSQSFTMASGSKFLCIGCNAYGSLSAGAGMSQILNQGGELWWEDSVSYELTSTIPVNNYQCSGAGGILHATNSTFGKNSTASTNVGILDTAACTAILQNSYLFGLGGSNFYTGVSGSKLISLGGNTFSGPASVNAGGLLEIAPSDNIAAVTSGITPTCASTGLAQTACALVAGSTNEKGTIRVTAGGIGGAFTETLTFVGAFAGPNATTPSCTFQYANTGTGSWVAPALLTTSSKSTTSYVIAGSGTTVNTNTFDMDYICVPR